MFNKKSGAYFKIFGQKNNGRDPRLIIALLAIVFFAGLFINYWRKSKMQLEHIANLEQQIIYLKQYNDRLGEQIEELAQSLRENN